MPQNKQKLELMWIGKENRPRLEPRILRGVENLPKGPPKPGQSNLFDEEAGS